MHYKRPVYCTILQKKAAQRLIADRKWTSMSVWCSSKPLQPERASGQAVILATLCRVSPCRSLNVSAVNGVQAGPRRQSEGRVWVPYTFLGGPQHGRQACSPVLLAHGRAWSSSPMTNKGFSHASEHAMLTSPKQSPASETWPHLYHLQGIYPPLLAFIGNLQATFASFELTYGQSHIKSLSSILSLPDTTTSQKQSHTCVRCQALSHFLFGRLCATTSEVGTCIGSNVTHVSGRTTPSTDACNWS